MSSVLSGPPAVRASSAVSRRLLVGLAVAVLLALWFVKLPNRALAHPDEGRYAEIPREMVATGDWVTPRLNGFVYLQKPPLQYWATAAAYEAFGPAEWTARLWTALTGLATVIVAWLAGLVSLAAQIEIPLGFTPVPISGQTFAVLLVGRVVVVFFVLLLLGARGTSWAGLTVLVPPAQRPLYATLAELPKTSVVAGWPGQAIDNVPYLSRRTAFVTRETHMPFHRRYTELIRERMRAFVAAYYASDPEPLRALHRRYGVTHLVVDRKHFAAPPPYFAPFDAEARLGRGGARHYATTDDPAWFAARGARLLGREIAVDAVRLRAVD